MAAAVKAVPDGYHTVTPYLIIKGAAEAIDFYKDAFGAVELMRLNGPGGTIGHAEIKIGDSHIMLADEFPDIGALSPLTIGGSPVRMMLYLEDVDARIDQAVKAGATLSRPVENQFYGDRCGAVTDPYGYQWFLATHIEDLTREEIAKRSAELYGT